MPTSCSLRHISQNHPPPPPPVHPRERLRRVSLLRQRGAAVSDVWLSVQAELRRLAQEARQGDLEASMTAAQRCQDHMESVREELVRRVHRRTVRAEVEQEQQWKQMFFKGIAKNKVGGFTFALVMDDC